MQKKYYKFVNCKYYDVCKIKKNKNMARVIVCK